MIRFLLPAALAGLLALSGAADAQPLPNSDVLADADRLAGQAREESGRGRHDAALSLYIRAIAEEPNDPRIITAAGEEALAIGDIDAAFGFLGRAVTLDPRSPRARAGYGRALVLSARPKDALTLFDQSVRLGLNETEIAADRGLARDLLGETRRAQRDYRLALTAYPGNTTLIERLGLSLAISGDRDAAIALVKPLTTRPESGNAYRTLAFIHALTGDLPTARRLALANMPVGQAEFIYALLRTDRADGRGGKGGRRPPRPPAEASFDAQWRW